MSGPLAGARRVAVVAPTWVGDLVMATPFFAALRRALPGARLLLLARPALRGVLAGAPWFDGVLEDAAGNRPFRILSLARRLRAESLDAAVLLPNSFRSALVLFLARAKVRIGYARDFRRPLLTHPVRASCGLHRHDPVFMGEYYARLADAAGIEGARGPMALFVTAEEEERCARVLGEAGIRDGERLIGLNVGARFGASKLWPPDHFAAVAEALGKRSGRRILVLAGPGEEQAAEAVKARSAHPAEILGPDRVPLDVLKALVRRLDLLVTNDTGPRHYAAALRVPVVTIYGPTHIGWSDGGFEKARNLQVKVPCGPCMRKRCPLDHRCMKELTPDRVIAAAEELLAGEPPGPPPQESRAGPGGK